MKSINDRILRCINSSGLTKTAFAQKIGLTQAYVSALSIGKKSPSDRTITDICREFNVNEKWLRTGEGEMLRQVDDDEKLKRIFEELSVSEDKTLKRVIRAYLRLTESEKAGFRQMLDNLVEEYSAVDGALSSVGEDIRVPPAVADATGQEQMDAAKEIEPDMQVLDGEELTTEEAEALYRSSSGYVANADLSALNTTDDKGSSGAKLA